MPAVAILDSPHRQAVRPKNRFLGAARAKPMSEMGHKRNSLERRIPYNFS
jgi:hypothetical protein